MAYTLQELQARHSVRSFTTDPLTERQVQALRSVISDINTHFQGLRFQLITDDTAPFDGRMGSYGVFKNARNYIAAVVDTGVANVYEMAGYAGEMAVMKGVSAGLGTCFVGGTFDPAKIPAQIRAGEKIYFIIPVGTPLGSERMLEKLMVSMIHRKKMTGRDFFSVEKSAYTLKQATDLYPLLPQALEAVACAPSAVNKRPVRIWIDTEKDIHASLTTDASFAPCDLGIAKFNFQEVFPGEWTWGDGARFLPF